MNTISIAIVGGDLRFVRLAQLMAEKNMDVRIYGITHPDIPESVKVCHALSDICECQYIIGPIPFSQDSKSVFTPLSNIYIPIEQYMVYAANSYSIVGALKKDIKLLFEKHHLKYKDLMDLDEVAILNAIPTAEGAIQYAMQNSEITLHGSKCLVLGFGRCGKILANKLRGIGVEVWVEARSTTDLAFISTYGYIPLPLNSLKNHIGEFDFIFNTIPVVLLDENCIKQFAPDVVYIELASAPGGIDLCACNANKVNHVPAPSLQGVNVVHQKKRAFKMLSFLSIHTS
ncbi:MAG: dipicolinate synthase subunit DpsA [Cellulosilyticaceae bacterium]